MGGRSRTASTAQWLVDGSVPSRGRRAWAWARRSVAGIGLPVSPERPERRESSSASPAASACPGPAGHAPSLGMSCVFRRPGLKMRRRADGGPASAANPGNGTGRRDPGRVRVRLSALTLCVLGVSSLPAYAEGEMARQVEMNCFVKEQSQEPSRRNGHSYLSAPFFVLAPTDPDKFKAAKTEIANAFQRYVGLPSDATDCNVWDKGRTASGSGQRLRRGVRARTRPEMPVYPLR